MMMSASPLLYLVDYLQPSASAVVRNVLVESARIARGNVKPLEQLSAAQFDAVVFPGGFGAAKNLYVAFVVTYFFCPIS